MSKRSIAAFVLLIGTFALAQEPAATPSAPPPRSGQLREGMGARGSGRFSGTAGTITAISGDTIKLKALDGSEATVKVSDKTQYRKDQKEAKIADFKAGDMIFVRGDRNSDGAVVADNVISRSDLGRMGAGGQGSMMMNGAGAGGAMQALMENWGKQFIAGTVKSIDGLKLTIEGPENRTATIEVDENTSFRKAGPQGAESITLADIKPGNTVIGRGAVNKEGTFVPTTLNVSERGMQNGFFMMGGPPQGQPPQKPQQPPQQ